MSRISDPQCLVARTKSLDSSDGDLAAEEKSMMTALEASRLLQIPPPPPPLAP